MSRAHSSVSVGLSVLALVVAPVHAHDTVLSVVSESGDRILSIQFFDVVEGVPARAVASSADGMFVEEFSLTPDFVLAHRWEPEITLADGSVSGRLYVPSAFGLGDVYMMTMTPQGETWIGRIDEVSRHSDPLRFEIPRELVDQFSQSKLGPALVGILIGAAAIAYLMETCAKAQSKLSGECCESAQKACNGSRVQGCGASGACGVGNCYKDYQCLSD